MITEINIKNFKSIVDLTLPLSNINVFIGENGCGKSNILEAVGFLGVAISQEVNTTNLHIKGIRNAKPELIQNSFKNKKGVNDVEFRIKRPIGDRLFETKISIRPENKNDIFSKWLVIPNDVGISNQRNIEGILTDTIIGNLLKSTKIQSLKKLEKKDVQPFVEQEVASFFDHIKNGHQIFNVDNVPMTLTVNNSKLELTVLGTNKTDAKIKNYLIYAPNISALRGFQVDSQVEPLGIYGENIDVLISTFNKNEIVHLSKYYNLVSWLDDVFIDSNDKLKLDGYKLGRSHSKIYFRDKFMGRGRNLFSAENANEGVLHILFYLALFISKRTPQFFGIDNIETALNPKLCRTLIKALCEIAIENEKQVLITTHHPAVLDGLNLHDDRQRLFVVKRNDEGHTQIERIKLKPETNGEQLKLSEMWMRGLLGGLPTNF